MLSILVSYSMTCPRDFVNGMMELKRLDEFRDTNLLDHFPEFEKYYKLNLKKI